MTEDGWESYVTTCTVCGKAVGLALPATPGIKWHGFMDQTGHRFEADMEDIRTIKQYLEKDHD